MAKLKGPLFSLGASGKIGNVLVYFGWKGLDVVREYVIPANPRSAAQLIQRGYFTAAVAALHAAQGLAAHALAEIDIVAYRALAGVYKPAMTWFNQVVKSWLDQRVDALRSAIYHGASMTGGDTIITAELYFTDAGANHQTAGDFWYGTSPTALINHVAASMFSAPYMAIGDLSGLTNGVKYYLQFRPTLHADFVGLRSGIYHATPSA